MTWEGGFFVDEGEGSRIHPDRMDQILSVLRTAGKQGQAPVPAGGQHIAARIQECTSFYLSHVAHEERRPPRRGIKGTMDQIRQQAGELRALLDSLPPEHSELIEAESHFARRALVHLERAAERAPVGGRSRKEALRLYVDQLADVFEDATGRRAARWWTHEEAGPFREFIGAVLHAVEPEAGIDYMLREVTRACSMEKT